MIDLIRKNNLELREKINNIENKYEKHVQLKLEIENLEKEYSEDINKLVNICEAYSFILNRKSKMIRNFNEASRIEYYTKYKGNIVEAKILLGDIDKELLKDELNNNLELKETTKTKKVKI